MQEALVAGPSEPTLSEVFSRYLTPVMSRSNSYAIEDRLGIGFLLLMFHFSSPPFQS